MLKHCLLAALLSIATNSAFASSACRSEVIEASNFSLAKISELSSAISTETDVVVTKLQYSVAPSGKDVAIDHRIAIRVNAILNDIYASAAADARSMSSESHVYNAGAPTMFVMNGLLVVRIPLTYTLKWWIKFDSICCRHFKCRKCYEKVWTKVIQKTIYFQVGIRGTVDPKPDLIAVEMPADLDAGGVERMLLAGVRKLAPGVLARIDTAASELDDDIEALHLSKIRGDLPSLRGLAPSGNGEKALIAFERNFKPESLSFVQDAGDSPNMLYIEKGEIDAAIFCEEVRPRLRETVAYLDSFRRQPVCETVESGGSYYSISDLHYGNGNCHVALTQINRLRGFDHRLLRPGDKVLVPPMYRILSPDSGKSVRAGDYRLKIAADATGTQSADATFLLPGDADNPDLIYPCQFTATGDRDALSEFIRKFDVCTADKSSPVL